MASVTCGLTAERPESAPELYALVSSMGLPLPQLLSLLRQDKRDGATTFARKSDGWLSLNPRLTSKNRLHFDARYRAMYENSLCPFVRQALAMCRNR